MLTFFNKINEEVKQVNNIYNNCNNCNNQTTINNNLNMFHIVNNYKDAYNLEDLMNSPLTDNEMDFIIKNGATAGCFELLKTRCIDNIELPKRPFHCVDMSRSKYMLRSNDTWNVDLKGEKILKQTCPKIRSVYPTDDLSDMVTYGKNMAQLLDMEYKSKKIIGYLNNKALLKNNATETESNMIENRK